MLVLADPRDNADTVVYVVGDSDDLVDVASSFGGPALADSTSLSTTNRRSTMSNSKKGRYVVGTASFDSEDETAEWAVGPHAWSPDGRYFRFPEAGDDDLAAVLDSVADLVAKLHPWTTINVDL